MTSLGLNLGLSTQRTLAPFVGALDAYATEASLAWSMQRRLFTSYTGPMCRIRRSVDDQEMDFSAGSNGFINTSNIDSWLGISTGYVVVIYDQSGYGRDLIQATATVQPLYEVLTNGRSSCDTGRIGVSGLMATTNFGLVQPNTVIVSGLMNHFDAGNYVFDGLVSDSGIVYEGASGGRQYLYAGTFLPAYDASTVLWNAGEAKVLIAEFNGGSSRLKIGDLSASGACGTSSMGGFTLGNRASPTGGGIRVSWIEGIVFPSVNTTTSDAVQELLNTNL